MSRAAARRRSLSDLPRHLAVDVDVDGAPDTDVTGEQCGRPLDDPTLIHEVEALQEAVIRHLSLELLQGPAAPSGKIPELVGERRPEGTRAAI